MGSNMSAEQQRMVADHLTRQENLVKSMQMIIDQQAEALVALDADDDDYNPDGEQDYDGEDSGEDEFDKVEETAATAEERPDCEPEVSAEEKRVEDEQYAEPTEEEERNFQATKPWLGAMAPPSGYRKDPAWDEAPPVKLTLEHVYGYRARLVRNNVFNIDDQTVLYFSAGVGIIHNLANNTQRFLLGHTDDILCMDYHPQRRLVVTGQQGRTPKCCVWELDSGNCLAELVGYHRRAVVSVAFSADGSRVACVGADNDHSVAVYNWQDNALIAESKGDTNKVVNVTWNRTKSGDGNSDFVTVGSKHIKFWSLAGSSLRARKGLLGKKGSRQWFLTVDFSQDMTLIGTQSGDVYGFSGNKLKSVVHGHTGMVYAVKTDQSTGRIYTGGRDGSLNVWENNAMTSRSSKPLKTIALGRLDPQAYGRNSVRAIHILPGSDSVLCGTLSSTIYKVHVPTGRIEPVVTGHFGDLAVKGEYGELWGVSPHPTKNEFATVGPDHTLRIWSANDRKQQEREAMVGAALCCHHSPDGSMLAVGMKDGSFSVFDTQTWMELIKKRVTRRRVCAVRFSPNGKHLAVASADNSIRIYDVTSDFKYVGNCTGASSAIIQIDWCKESKWIQSVSQAYELLFFDGPEAKFHSRSRELKDVEWATQSCTLGWNVQGIWPKFSDGSDVNVVARSNNQRLLCSAEDSGLVKVFNFPCVGSHLDRRGKLSRRPDSYRAQAHSSHVTNVCWLNDDSRVVSVGGADLATMQWRVDTA